MVFQAIILCQIQLLALFTALGCSNRSGNLVWKGLLVSKQYSCFIKFAERSEIPKSDLLARLTFAVNEADEVLKAFDPRKLLETPSRGTRPTSYMETIDYQLVHYAAHTGQIAFATKMLKADAIDDIWRKISSRRQ